ncbi:MAG: SDR family oxidoreductase [Candidatus Levybacteria bacterium]|nr:SDR family oxidoreductase [Candidatus Levybacteria bacterium]
MKILGTGLNGLIGSRIVDLLKEKHTFENISRSTGADITDYDSVLKAISSFDADIVLHLAAYTDVKQAEKERDLGEKSQSWKINVVGTDNVAKACSKLSKKLIYFSTDLVLGGDDMPVGGFSERSVPNPLSFYAKTKYEAEKIVNQLQTPWLIIRLAYPYRASFEKPDFVRFFKTWLSEKKPIAVLEDRLVTPTFIDDLGLAIDTLIEKDETGVYHAVGSQIISMYDAVLLIAKTFNLDQGLVSKTTRKEFLVGRPPEPFSSALNNAKIRRLGVVMHTLEEGLSIIKENL